MEFVKQFLAARRVSTPLINIRTFDAISTKNSIFKALGESTVEETALLLWDCIHGLTPLNETDKTKDAVHIIVADEGQGMTVPVTNALRMMERPELTDAVIFISNSHLQWEGGDRAAFIQAVWNLRDMYKANGNILLLMSSPGTTLPSELANDVLVLDEPLPTPAELAKTVRDTFTFGKVEDDVTDEIVAKATDALIGLPAFSAEQATAMSLETTVTETGKGKDKVSVRKGNLNIGDLWGRKIQIINQTPGLSIWQGKETLDDIGGVESAKEFYKAVMEGNNPPKVIIFIDEIEKAFAGTGTDMSGTKTEMTGSMLSWMQDRKIRGLMSIGIPGVSKSALIKAVGGTYGIPVIIFDIAGMQDSLVGNSGRRLREAEKVVDAISGDQPGSVLAAATCNGIAALPPELRRRFSLAQFFFDAPNEAEKKVIWDIHRKKQGISTDESNPADKGWTGAEIESCCEKASMLNWTLAKAATFIVPVTESAKELIAKTRDEANGKYLSASLPGIYRSNESTVTKTIQGPQYADNARKMRD